MIREACLDDIPRLVAMGQRFVSSSCYAAKFASDPKAIKTLMSRLIISDDGMVLVSQKAGRVVGMIGVLVYPHPWAGIQVASEVFWWVEPEVRGDGVKLLRCAEQWARTKQATKMQMVAPNARVAQAYEAMGYGKLEEFYQRDL